MKRIKQLLETLKKPDWYFPIVIVAIVAVFAGVLGSAMLRGESVDHFPGVKKKVECGENLSDDNNFMEVGPVNE